MAQRRRADGRLARPAKTTSARIPLLALVVAALLLAFSGCGGDDSDSNSATASATGVSGAEGPAGSGASVQAAGKVTSKSSAANPSSPSTPPGSSSAEQGSSVPIPKGAPEPGLTLQQREEATVASIELSSPTIEPAAVGSTARLPAAYTCDGKDTWPELGWQGVPPGTSELALFAMGVKPVAGKIFFDWAVASLDPELTGIEEGRLPKDAVVGRNGFGRVGYSICPGGDRETFFFALYALPERLNPPKGFDPHDLRKQVLLASSDGGLMAVSYARQ